MNAGMGRKDENENVAMVREERRSGQASIFCIQPYDSLVLGDEP